MSTIPLKQADLVFPRNSTLTPTVDLMLKHQAMRCRMQLMRECLSTIAMMISNHWTRLHNRFYTLIVLVTVNAVLLEGIIKLLPHLKINNSLRAVSAIRLINLLLKVVAFILCCFRTKSMLLLKLLKTITMIPMSFVLEALISAPFEEKLSIYNS